MTIDNISSEKSYFELLQGLRAFAAIIVMIGHIKHEILMVSVKLGQDAPLWTSWKLPYNAGVDIFFVLSGFLMVYTARNLNGEHGAWKTFLKKRFQRIVPLYWFYTTLMIIVVLAMPSAFDTAQASISHFIQSYLFVPHERPAGGIKPLLSLGWTLNYEMFFYLVFAALLFLKRQYMVLIIGALFIGIAISHEYVQGYYAITTFLSRPIILEFVMGMVIANLYLSNIRLPKQMVWLCVFASVCAFIYAPYSHNVGGIDFYRIPNMIMAVLLLGGFTLCRDMVDIRVPRVIKALGDSSYTLYLAHPFGIGAVALLVKHFSLSPTIHFWSSLFVCLIGSYIAYLLIEKNIVGYFKAKHCP